MLVFIEVLRAIATLLIFNSHLKGVYPVDILSFGGGLGLALFYMLSGYLLSNINENTKFHKWYFKKITRIYVPLILFRIILVVIGNIQINSFIGFIKIFVFPTYWFVASMVIFYAVYFVFVKYIYGKFGKKSIIGAWIVCGISFTVLYATKIPIALFSLEKLQICDQFSIETPYLITQFVWFSTMLLGLYLKEFPINQTKMNNKKYLFLASSVVCVLCFLGIRVFEKFGLNFEFLLPVSYIGFAYFIFEFFELIENELKKLHQKIIFKPVRIISMCSLEIYFVQFVWINLFKEIMFPVNLVLIIGVTIIVGLLLHIVSNKLLNINIKKKCY
ncbi:MAG: acyltransferase [Ruminococcaceae bacterium]|nr:acyltransferase [Oscillospiraceae bacterium]